MMFKAILVTAVPIIVVSGLYLAHRSKAPRVLNEELSYRNADNIGDGAAPWNATTQAKYPPQPPLPRMHEIEPRGM